MKSKIHYSKRKFTTEPCSERMPKPVYDFSQLIAATKAWK